MKKYKHLFFDIDRTLWDYESNAKEALHDMYIKYQLLKHHIPFEDFVRVFKRNNEFLWLEFGLGKIKKEYLRDQRFFLSLEEFGIKDNALATQLSVDYIEISPNKINLFPEVADTLEYLSYKYKLHIITNGFNEVQFRKLKNCGIDQYFEKVVTSDNAQSQKPNRRIFEFALNSVNAKKKESLMIGDDWELDVMGAKKYGFDQVFFNPDRKNITGTSTYRIERFGELKDIL